MPRLSGSSPEMSGTAEACPVVRLLRDSMSGNSALMSGSSALGCLDVRLFGSRLGVGAFGLPDVRQFAGLSGLVSGLVVFDVRQFG